MKRQTTYILTTLAVLGFCLSASAQTREKQDSVVAYAWNDVKTFEEATGSFKSVKQEDLDKRVIGDLRGRFVNMIPGLWITESGGSYFVTNTGSFNAFAFSGGAYNAYSKGTSYTYCIVDDVPVPFNQLQLEPNQIESITFVDDILDKVKLGPLGATGAIVIKTKRGSFNTPLKVTVDFESGVSRVGNVPEWCSGAEYAQLNNYARNASGMVPLYSDEAIEAFRLRNPYDPAYPCVDYRSLMMKDMFDVNNFAINATAGSDKIKYNISANALRSGDYRNSEDSDFYRFTLSGNVTSKIGRWVEIGAAFNGVLAYHTYGNYDPLNFFSVPECAYPLILDVVGEDEEDVKLVGRKIYGVSKTFGNNYYAQMLEGGFYQGRDRSGFFNAHVDLDLGWLLKGLKSRTQVQESSFVYTKIGKSNAYIAHYWDPDLGMGERSTSHTGERKTSRSTSATNASQSLNIAENLWYDWAGNGHKVHADGTFSVTDYSQSNDSNRQRLMYAIAAARYSYKERYTVEAAGQWAGSPRYMKGSRWGFFPTLGLAWNLGNEEFLKDVKAIDKLKLRAQIGDAPRGNEVFGTQYLYQASYTNASGNAYGPVQNGGERWFGVNMHTSTPTTVARMAAEDLTWERISEKLVGIDGDLFGCLRFGAELYRYDKLGTISNVNSVIPEVYGLDGITLYKNYASDRTEGWDAYLQFHKKFGELFVTAGGYLSHWDCTYTKMVDDTYSEEYQKKTGTSTSSIWGYKCIGRYQSQEEIDALPSYIAKDQLSIGDLIYNDTNNDGNVDTNDRVIIGSTQPKLRYSLNLGLEWKNLDFQVTAMGLYGCDYNLQGNGYFTRGSGDENLSAFVRDGLISGEYPSLSYYQSTNNFIASSFWLRDRSYFKIQNVEIGYNFNFKKDAAVKGLRLALKGNNLGTFSSLPYIDAECPSAGISTRPLMSIYTLNAKIRF